MVPPTVDRQEYQSWYEKCKRSYISIHENGYSTFVYCIWIIASNNHAVRAYQIWYCDPRKFIHLNVMVSN
jgi:hypothetical protein